MSKYVTKNNLVNVINGALAKAPTLQGATASADGKKGLVPAPTTGDVSKFLCGDGTWKVTGGGGGINVIKDTLWEGATRTSGTLSKDYTDYDYLLFHFGYNNGVNPNSLKHIEVCDTSYDNFEIIFIQYRNSITTALFDTTFTNGTSFTINTVEPTNEAYLIKIEGLKFVNQNVYSTLV